jgi:hypothetical protein
MKQFYGEVEAQKSQIARQMAPLEEQLSAARSQVTSAQQAYEQHLAAKPTALTANDPWLTQRDGLAQGVKEAKAKVTGLQRNLEALAKTPLTVEGASVPATRVGPVLAVVVDNTTGKAYRAINDPANAVPAKIHPLLQERFASLDATRTHGSAPGSHAEVYALNEALLAREKATGKPVTQADLRSFTLDTVWVKGGTGTGKGMTPGLPAERCANCTQLTRGVKNLPGDSVKPFDVAQGVKPGRPPPYRYFHNDVEAAKGGAKAGAAVGAIASAAEALKDGKLDAGDAVDIAKGTAVGAGAGAAFGAVEQVAARGIDRVAGKAIERGAAAVVGNTAATGARVVASRVGGAGVAGAVVGAAFSAVDNVGAYRRGELTGAQAIGNVAGDAVVGMGAGMAGAAAGAAIGSIIPGAGTVVGGVIGFGVGMAAGYLADKGLRALEVDKVISRGVTAAIDTGAEMVSGAANALSGAASRLSSVFGW